MNLEEFRQHVDARFDKLEDKLSEAAVKNVSNTKDVEWLKGSVSILTTIVLALAGFFAMAFFDKL